MILGLSIAAFTKLHVAISLIGIVSGLVVLYGMLGAQRMPWRCSSPPPCSPA
ncbi:hypothetical protein [Methyloceanibacter sp.]|uniref:hypothetical protein n=1 Tax=Methyloceanibacter sp. TaxID=1965321 RepID=UPI00351B03A6